MHKKVLFILLVFILPQLASSIWPKINIMDFDRVYKSLKTPLDYIKNNEGINADNSYLVRLDVPNFSSHSLNIKGGQCITGLKINETIKSHKKSKRKCKKNEIYSINLTPNLHSGINTLLITFDKTIAERDIEVSNDSYFDEAFFVSVVILSVLISWCWNPFDKKTKLFFLSAALALCVNLFLTNPFKNPLDRWAHSSTIDYYAKHLSIPPPNLLAESHQPPLYYFASGVLKKIGYAFESRKNSSVRYATFIIYLIMLSYAIRFVRLVLPKQHWLTHVATICVLFWPANFFHCCRISNDIPLYASMMAAMFYLTSWFIDEKKADFIKAIASISLGFLIKSSAVISVMFLCTALALKYLQKRSISEIKNCLPNKKMLTGLAIILIVSASFNSTRIILVNYTQGKNYSVLIGTGARHAAVEHPNHIDPTLKNYLTMDYTRYINQPYWDYGNKNSDREYFWNLYFKSYLYSMLRNGKYPNIASVMNMLFLIAYCNFILMALYHFLLKKHYIGVISLTGLFKLAIVSSMIAMQLKYPEPGYADTRHTYPTVLLFVIMYFCMTYEHIQSRWRLLMILTPIISLVSLSFYWTLMQKI